MITENKNEMITKVEALKKKISGMQQEVADLMREHDAYVLLLSIGQPIKQTEEAEG